MYTFITLLSILGAFLIVNTSRRAVLRDLGMFNFIPKNKNIFKGIGVLCMLVPLVVLMAQINNTTAIMIWLNLIGMATMLVVIINPLKSVRYAHVLGVGLVFLLIEICVTYAG